MKYEEFDYEDRTYIIPKGSAFISIQKQPRPNVNAIRLMGVGDNCPMSDGGACIAIDDRNLTSRCRCFESYGDEIDGVADLEQVKCSCEDDRQSRKVVFLKTAFDCAIDKVGCIHPKGGIEHGLDQCKNLLAYVPSDLSIPHDRVSCYYLRGNHYKWPMDGLGI